MPDTDFTKGFTGAFTWENIGLQTANGLISGGASFAINMLLSTLKDQSVNMGEMFQKFADQIVERISVNMKQTIADALYQQEFSHLKTRSAAMEDEYRSYLITHSDNILDHLEEISFEIDRKAIEIGIPAIGIYCVEKIIQVSIFKEKAQLNTAYETLIVDKIKEAKEHLNTLREEAVKRVLSAFSYRQISQYKDGEADVSGYIIYYESQTLDSVIILSGGKETGANFNAIYEFHKQQKIAEFDQQIYPPAKAIIDRL